MIFGWAPISCTVILRQYMVLKPSGFVPVLVINYRHPMTHLALVLPLACERERTGSCILRYHLVQVEVYTYKMY